MGRDRGGPEEQGRGRLFTEVCSVILSVTLRGNNNDSIHHLSYSYYQALKYFENYISVPNYTTRQVLLSPPFYRQGN